MLNNTANFNIENKANYDQDGHNNTSSNSNNLLDRDENDEINEITENNEEISEYDDYISDSEDDSDDSDENNDEEEFIYEYHENSHSKFNIVLCELYNLNIHGKTKKSFVYYHFLTIYRFKLLNIKLIKKFCYFYMKHYKSLSEKISKNTVFENYINIINKNNYIKPEIAECIKLSNEFSVCIIKTIWIRLIQRSWKKIYQIRKEIMRKRCSLKSLSYREQNGYWNNDCNYLPGLKGLISYLKK